MKHLVKTLYFSENFNKNTIIVKISVKTLYFSEILPKDSFIFCCFNTTYKITPVELDIWSKL